MNTWKNIFLGNINSWRIQWLKITDKQKNSNLFFLYLKSIQPSQKEKMYIILFPITKIGLNAFF